MSRPLYTDILECDGYCGSSIQITSTNKNKREADTAAEALGWTTRDHKKKTEVYCPNCQERAKRIVGGR